MNRFSTHSLVYSAIGAGLIACLSQISLSIGPVPFTLQTLAIGLIACLYKPTEAVASVFIYLLLGAIGFPVFAGFSGGFQALFGPTAGFLWGFLLYALVTSYLTRTNSHPVQLFLALLLGDAICFLAGFLVFHFITKTPWTDTLGFVVLPFILPDLAKIILATSLHRLLQPTLKRQAYFQQ